jgi:hypothetical protein
MRNMFVVPVHFVKEHKRMLAHAKKVLEYNGGSIAINVSSLLCHDSPPLDGLCIRVDLDHLVKVFFRSRLSTIIYHCS